MLYAIISKRVFVHQKMSSIDLEQVARLAANEKIFADYLKTDLGHICVRERERMPPSTEWCGKQPCALLRKRKKAASPKPADVELVAPVEAPIKKPRKSRAKKTTAATASVPAGSSPMHITIGGETVALVRLESNSTE